jgi:hypothetical protein
MYQNQKIFLGKRLLCQTSCVKGIRSSGLFTYGLYYIVIPFLVISIHYYELMTFKYPLDQACQTQNTVWAAHEVLTAKNPYADRSLKIYNTFCNTFFLNIHKFYQFIIFYHFMLEITAIF